MRRLFSSVANWRVPQSIAASEIKGNGRGLVASRNFEMGEVVLAEEPIVAVAHAGVTGVRTRGCVAEGEALANAALCETPAGKELVDIFLHSEEGRKYPIMTLRMGESFFAFSASTAPPP